MLPSREKGKPS
uniref:Uncharacterized protein n=1 Tax=Nymphaea colorata TaxID=210225 RepID=A0A5K0VLE3_9MAGN